MRTPIQLQGLTGCARKNKNNVGDFLHRRMRKRTPNICETIRKTAKFEFGAVQKRVNLVALEKYCKMILQSQKSASGQLRAGRPL